VSTMVGALGAAARGNMTLAAALAVPAEALAAARAMASLLAQHGREDAARVVLEGIVALDEHDAWSWRALATLALRRRDIGPAVEAATHAVQVARARGATDPEAALLLGRALLAAGRAPEAGTWLASAAADPHAPPAVRRTARAIGRRMRGT